MIAALLIAAPVATALLIAASLRLPSLVSTLLVAYLVFVANLGLVTWALSPLRAVDRGGLAAAEGGPADGRRCRLVAPRPAGTAPRVGAAGSAAGAGGSGRRGLPRRRRCATRVRARACADGTGRQLGLAHLPPLARRRVDAARRDLSHPERADAADERVPAARRAADPLSLRCDGSRRALRAAAVSGARGDPPRDLWRRTPPWVPAAPRRLCRAPVRDVLARRPPVDDVAERSRRCVVSSRGALSAARQQRASSSLRSRVRQSGSGSARS